MRALVPLVEGVELIGPLPAGVRVDVWDASGDPPGGGDGVEVWVPPFPPIDDYETPLSKLPQLRVVQMLTAGYDHIRPYVPDEVTLCNAGSVHDGPAAEWVLSALLAVVRRLPIYVEEQRSGSVMRKESDTLIGKTVLILGYGGIGQAVERRLAGFEVKVIRVASRAREGVHGPEDLPDLLPRADVVVLALPLSDRTRDLVDAEFLACLPDGAIVVNASRGPVVDQEALQAELERERLRAALDVTTPDPLQAEHPIRFLRNVLYTPHVAGATRLVLPRAFGLVGDQIRRCHGREPLTNVVAGPVDPGRAPAPRVDAE
ncbi:MAG TPA: 2-hydroxyacid dehydrogenase [Solirubrobacteraceae bacterium]|nr:2-hydroxyacid dehydrogenase [Solirubrobacteraceae bacterium]